MSDLNETFLISTNSKNSKTDENWSDDEGAFADCMTLESGSANHDKLQNSATAAYRKNNISNSGTTTRTKKKNIPPHLEPDLPTTAKDINDSTSFEKALTLLTGTIIEAVSKNRSVSASNKRLIICAAEEIRKATLAHATLRKIKPSIMTTKLDKLATAPALTTSNLNATDASDPVSLSALDKMRKELMNCTKEIRGLRSELAASGGGPPATYAQMASRLPKRDTGPTSTPSTHPLHVPLPNPISRHAIIVTTKENCKTRQEAISAWRNTISFKNSSYAPYSVRPISHNKLRVEFETQIQRDDTLRRLNFPEAQVSAEAAKNIMPMIILKGISKDIPPEELTEILATQNPDLCNDYNEIKLRFLRYNRNPLLYSAVLTVYPTVWRKALEQGRLNVDHQKVRVKQFSPFMQCRECLQFGHTIRHCRNRDVETSPTCAYCASKNHSETDCQEKARKASPKCINCISRKNKFNTDDDISHTANSPSCPILRAMRRRVESRINYGP